MSVKILYPSPHVVDPVSTPVDYQSGIIVSGQTTNTTPGYLSWNSSISCLEVVNEFAGSVLQIGQEMYICGYNNTAGILAEGTVVYLSGFYAEHCFKVNKAMADSLDTAKVLGVVTTEMAPGAKGFVVIFGGIHGLDTSLEAEGAEVFLSDSALGEWTTTKPPVPIRIGYIGTVDASDGAILVNIDGKPPSVFGTFSLVVPKTFLLANTSEVIPFDTEIAVAGVGHSTTVNPEEIEIISSGTYVISVGFHINRTLGASSQDFVAWLELYPNGGSAWTPVPGTAVRSSVFNAGDTLRFAASMAEKFARGDKLRVGAQVTDTNIILKYLAASGDIPSQAAAGFRINRIGD